MTKFAKVNISGSGSYDPSYQKHHILPLQIGRIAEFGSLFANSKDAPFNLDEFETNGILLPSQEAEALTTGKLMHRGPHPIYNEMVIERLNLIFRLGEQIDGYLEQQSFLSMRITLLQRSLKRGLFGRNIPKLQLSRRDPNFNLYDLRTIDADIDRLCALTKWTIDDRCG